MRLAIPVMMVLVILSSGVVQADEVFLKNGSHVIGTVKGVKDGKLIVGTEFAGDIEISLDQVQGVETENPTGFKLDTGEVLSGQLTIRGEVQMLSGEGVDRTVAPTGIVAIGDPLVLSAPPAADWSGRAELSIQAETGNTESFDALAQVSATRTTANSRLILTFRAERDYDDGDRTTNEVLGRARYERDVSERFFWYTAMLLEFDEFEDLNLRTRLSAGVGYTVVDNDRHTFRVFSGLGYEHEEFDDGISDDSLLGEFGYRYLLRLSKWFRFSSDFAFYLNFTDFDAWRFEAENAGEIPLSNKEQWKLRFGVRNEYDHAPQPGVEELDTTYFTSIVYDWD